MTSHTQILRIARAGNPARAMQLFVEQGLDTVRDDPSVLTLKGRLLKDHAKLSEGATARELFARSFEAYLAAHELDGSSYALINAASLAMLGGHRERSRELAQQVLDMLEADPEEGETPYWREATRAEALLLLGLINKARAALAIAWDLASLAHEDHAATIGQFERILTVLGEDLGWLDEFRPPVSLHFSGLIRLDENATGLIDKVHEYLDRTHPGYAFGALAAGADIIIAEAAVARGAELHVTLPDTLDAFRATSVQPFGSHWGTRFDALIESAFSVEAMPVHLWGADAPLARRVELASLVAMGQCQRNADNLRSTAEAVTIADPDEPDRQHIRHWLETGRPLERIATRRRSLPGEVSTTIPLQGANPPEVLGVALLTGVPNSDLLDLAQQHGMIAVSGSTDPFYVGQPVTAIEFVKACTGKYPENRTSLAIDVIEMDRPSEVLLDRMRLIAQASDLSQIMMDRQAALASKVLDQQIWIEEIGEIASNTGPISVWAGRYSSSA